MLITNKHASFYLWWKKKSVKYQKVSKYYVYGCTFYIFLQRHQKTVMFGLTHFCGIITKNSSQNMAILNKWSCQ